jgi:hypothetical protein
MDVHTTLLPTLSAEVKARNHPQIPPSEIDMVRMWEINTWSCLIWHSNMLAGKTNAHNWRNSQGYKQMEHHSLTMARSNAPTLNIITLLTLRIKWSPRKLGIPELSVSRRRNTLITLTTTVNIITLITLRIKWSPPKLGIPQLSVSRRRNTAITLMTLRLLNDQTMTAATLSKTKPTSFVKYTTWTHASFSLVILWFP